MRLQQHVAIVTGGAQGIGGAIARRLAEEGASVLIADIANAVVFLCSDEASFITGHALPVDGGLTIQLQEDLAVQLGQWRREHPAGDRLP